MTRGTRGKGVPSVLTRRRPVNGGVCVNEGPVLSPSDTFRLAVGAHRASLVQRCRWTGARGVALRASQPKQAGIAGGSHPAPRRGSQCVTHVKNDCIPLVAQSDGSHPAHELSGQGWSTGAEPVTAATVAAPTNVLPCGPASTALCSALPETSSLQL